MKKFASFLLIVCSVCWGTEEGIAKLQFGAKSALFEQDPDSAQIAYSKSSMSICPETGPAQKSSNLASKANFATPSGNLELLIGPEEISEKIAEVAAVIDKEYSGEELTVVMVMKGAVCVASDLLRQLQIPCTVEYMKASSYGKNGTSRGELKITGLEDIDLSSKHVLVVDDIFDTGNTMASIVSRLKEANPKSLKSLVLLKKNVPHHTTYRPDYTLFEIEDRFVIGFGLDYKEYYRNLPGIYAFVNDTPPN